MRDDRLRLQDILDAITQIETYARRGRKVFDEDPLIRTWILYHLQIVGEACRGLSEPFRCAHPETPWSDWCTSTLGSIWTRRGRWSSRTFQA
jgi:uncharacterized protein with HEPN domain